MLFYVFLDEQLRSKNINKSSNRHCENVPNAIEHTNIVYVRVCHKYKELHLLRGRGVKLFGAKIVSRSIFKVLDWDGRYIYTTEPKVSCATVHPNECLQEKESPKNSAKPSD